MKALNKSLENGEHIDQRYWTITSSVWFERIKKPWPSSTLLAFLALRPKYPGETRMGLDQKSPTLTPSSCTVHNMGGVDLFDSR